MINFLRSCFVTASFYIEFSKLIEPLDLAFSKEKTLNKKFIKEIDDAEFKRIAVNYYDINLTNQFPVSPIFSRDKNIIKEYLHK